jgi:hypothetical protein
VKPIELSYDDTHIAIVSLYGVFVLNNLVMTDRLARQRGTTLTLQVGTAPIVHTALEVSGLLEVLQCAPTREAAITAARNASRWGEESQAV